MIRRCRTGGLAAVTVFNATETLVRIMFQDEYIQQRLTCNCSACRDDILALTLSRLPSRYVSTDQGEAYVKAQFLNSQLQSDILKELAISMDIVAVRPRHAPPSGA